MKVLEQIGASQVPILEVYNKIDQNLDMLKDGFSNYYGVKISALYGLGIDELMNAISDALGIESMNFQLKLMPINANIRVEFKKLDAIKKRK